MLICLVIVLLFVGGSAFSTAHAQSPDPSDGDLIITEIMYAPQGSDTDQEYVEVYNTTSQPIDLHAWTLVGEDPTSSDPTQDDIDQQVTVGAKAFAVLCENGDSEENGGIECAYDYVNDIDHTSTADYVILLNPQGAEIDRVRYDEDSGWPEAIDASLEYTGGPDMSTSPPSNWQRATSRAGDFDGSNGANLGSPNQNAPGGALPVELTTFTVNRDEQRALLQWTTASETGNAGFSIQRRGPGRSGWSESGFVEGEGTTDEPTAYRYTTSALSPGTHSFRLKQIDLNGATHVSPPRRLEVPVSSMITLHGPNPLRGGQGLTITVYRSRRRAVDLALYNLLGQRVRRYSARGQRAGQSSRIRLQTEGLSAGTYFLRARGAGHTWTRQITILD